jgi:hypothetical protein
MFISGIYTLVYFHFQVESLQSINKRKNYVQNTNCWSKQKFINNSSKQVVPQYDSHINSNHLKRLFILDISLWIYFNMDLESLKLDVKWIFINKILSGSLRWPSLLNRQTNAFFFVYFPWICYLCIVCHFFV